MPDISRQRWNIDFDVAKSMRYHAYRRSFFETADRIAKILTLISGMAAFATLIAWGQTFGLIATGVVSVVAAIDIVVGFSQKALRHDHLYRDFSMLSQDIARTLTPTPEDVGGWVVRRREIEMREPGIIDLLERRCAGEEAAARGAELNELWKLKRWEIVLSQFVFWPTLRPASPEAT